MTEKANILFYISWNKFNSTFILPDSIAFGVSKKSPCNSPTKRVWRSNRILAANMDLQQVQQNCYTNGLLLNWITSHNTAVILTSSEIGTLHRPLRFVEHFIQISIKLNVYLNMIIHICLIISLNNCINGFNSNSLISYYCYHIHTFYTAYHQQRYYSHN